MSEYCKSCAMVILKMTDEELDRAVLSAEPERCEGCWKMKPVIVRIKPTMKEKIRRMFGR